MHIATTVPTGDPAQSDELFAQLERIGYDTAIAFARNPMVLANIGDDLQRISGGRFVLGLGSQVRPHIQNRFSETWSRPAARMRELVLAVRAIWDCWEGGAPPVFVGGFGPRMIEIAGEVADGLIVHPFNSRRSLEELVVPALARGRATA